jgi:hypothetical protein
LEKTIDEVWNKSTRDLLVREETTNPQIVSAKPQGISGLILGPFKKWSGRSVVLAVFDVCRYLVLEERRKVVVDGSVPPRGDFVGAYSAIDGVVIKVDSRVVGHESAPLIAPGRRVIILKTAMLRPHSSAQVRRESGPTTGATQPTGGDWPCFWM